MELQTKHGRRYSKSGRQRPQVKAPETLQKMLSFAGENGINFQAERILVMCSGGIDSVALTHMIACLTRPNAPHAVGIVFIDHGRRDVNADRDCVSALANQLKLPVYLETIEIGRASQAVMRSERYSAAIRAMQRENYTLLASAHHLDDQLETVLYGMVAHSGIRSMTGIPPVAQMDGATVIRPMLSLTRSDIKDWARVHDLRWVEDPTNAQTQKYRRNHVRHKVLPQLVKVHPGAGNNIERTRRQLSQISDATNSLVEGLFLTIVDIDGNLLTDTAEWRTLNDAAQRTVLAAWLRRQGAGRSLQSTTIDDILTRLRQAPGEVTDITVKAGSIHFNPRHITYTPGQDN